MTGLIVLAVYVAIFALSYLVVTGLTRAFQKTRDYTSLKTVTFGDESAVRPNRVASVISVATIFLLWVAFTNSAIPLPKFPGPFEGEYTFTYTSTLDDGTRDDAEVTVIVYREDLALLTDAEGNQLREPDEPEVPPGEGFAKNDSATVKRYGGVNILVFRNDEVDRDAGARVTALNGIEVGYGEGIDVPEGRLMLTDKGTPRFEPKRGLRMQRLYLPAPEVVWQRFLELMRDGYRNFSLLEHLGISLQRVLLGFFLGSLVGIPLGYAMGLTNWARGWFDPIVEFMRPVPPLALIPLMIIWFGIFEASKVILLFLAALWIMAIAARSGVSGVAISKVHAAYSLGASKWQILRKVIIPNSLPEIFTGARVAMGVCWGTVVAAELVAAERGIGMMIMVASKFQLTDIVIVGIIVIGIVGFGIDLLMRKAEKWLVPWKGRV